MVSQDLLDILVCPACKTEVKLVRETWLACQNPECRRKYPIRDDIPVMLIEEGTKWIDVDEQDLPQP